MERYIKWLNHELGGRFCYLIWDLHSSHRDAGVKEKAHKKHVNLSFIPAGQTGQWQPLDRRVYGAVKQEAMDRLNEICIDEDLASLDMVDALCILVDVWNELEPDDIKKSWDHLFIADDVPQELQEGDEEDDDGLSLVSSDGPDEEEDESYSAEGEAEMQFVEEWAETPIEEEEGSW